MSQVLISNQDKRQSNHDKLIVPLYVTPHSSLLVVQDNIWEPDESGGNT